MKHEEKSNCKIRNVVSNTALSNTYVKCAGDRPGTVPEAGMEGGKDKRCGQREQRAWRFARGRRRQAEMSSVWLKQRDGLGRQKQAGRTSKGQIMGGFVRQLAERDFNLQVTGNRERAWVGETAPSGSCTSAGVLPPRCGKWTGEDYERQGRQLRADLVWRRLSQGPGGGREGNCMNSRHRQEIDWTGRHGEWRKVNWVWCPGVCFYYFGNQEKVNYGGRGRWEIAESLFLSTVFSKVEITNRRRATICFSNDLTHKYVHIFKAGRCI